MEQYSLFEYYLEDKLNAQQRAEFEDRLNSDQTFKENFEWHLNSQYVFDQILESDLKKEIKNIAGKPKRRLISFRPMMMIAASLTLLIAAIFLLRSPADNSNSFEKFYRFPDYVEIERGGDSENPHREREIKFLIGHQKIAKDINDAISIFEELSADQEAIYAKESSWFLALCLYKNNQLSNSKILLEGILSDDTHRYNSEARALLEKFNSK